LFSQWLYFGDTKRKIIFSLFTRSVPPKILLVEDDDMCRKLSSKLLQVFGCTFDVATDGLDAVEKMNYGNKYDIVLMVM